MLAFAAKDHSFIGNLEQCNGCAGCRKDEPTMCPTFLATGEEYMSTRGRANAIRAALELRDEGGDPLRAQILEDALSNCLSCKACTTECPSNVNLTLLKAELMHARHERDGLPLRVRMLSAVDLLGRIGCALPALANAALDFPPLRAVLEKTLGLSAQRTLPHYARERFDHWFVRQSHRCNGSSRGKVILWDDTFVRYHEPQIGIAAVTVLEALGFEVELPAKSQMLRTPGFQPGKSGAKRRDSARHNLELLEPANDTTPILFLEPSCYSMFVEDYRELRLPERAGGRGALLSFREIHRRFARAGTGRASIRASARPGSRFTRIATRNRFSTPASWCDWRNDCPAARRLCSTPAVAAWPAPSGCWRRNTSSHSRSPRR